MTVEDWLASIPDEEWYRICNGGFVALAAFAYTAGHSQGYDDGCNDTILKERG